MDGTTGAMLIIRRGVCLVHLCVFHEDFDDIVWIGNVTYLNQPDAVASGLTYVNSANHAIIKVDNTTNIAPAPLVHRNSVR